MQAARKQASQVEAGWLATAKRLDSPNFNARPKGLGISLLVVHYISLPPAKFSGQAVQDLFLNKLDYGAHPYFEALRGLTVSAHFFIRRRGELLQFVSAEQRAWHAGLSQYKGRDNCNDFSIGVELEGDGEHPFTVAQYRRLADLTIQLSAFYPLQDAVGHSDIAPGRKIDPGPYFSWSRYADSLERLSSPDQKKNSNFKALLRKVAKRSV